MKDRNKKKKPMIKEDISIIISNKKKPKKPNPSRYQKVLSPKENKMAKVMHEFKEGELPIGKSKKKVKKRSQAIAIGLSEARKRK